jgi:hypothetical protein
MKEHPCNTYIVKSNLRSKKSCVILSNQDVYVCGCMWWIYMVANLILLCFLEIYLSFETWEQLCKKICDILFISFFFFQVGIWVSIVLDILDTCPFYLNFFFFFSFMNNFCIALCFFSQWELGAFIWWISYRAYFWLFTLSVRVKYFWVNLNGMTYLCAYLQCRSSAYVSGVYVILILRAW